MPSCAITWSKVYHGSISRSTCLARWTLLATALHLVFMGGAGWLNRDDWTAAKGLPAITLLAFGLALAGMALKPAAAESDPAA
jgi:hypothetical protein